MARWFSRAAATGVALGLTLFGAAPASAAPPNTHCTLTTPVQEVPSASQLPPELLRLLPPIADVGAPFNSTDSVRDPSLPVLPPQATVLANAGTISDTLCTLTDGVYAGQVPPYPKKAWAATDF